MADVTKKITVAVEAVVGNSASKLNNFVKSTKDVEDNLKGVAGASDVASTALGVFTGTLAADVAKAFGSAIADIAIKIKDLGLETQQTIAKIGAMKNYIGDATQAYQYFNDVGRNTNYDLGAVQQMGAQLLNLGYSAQNAADMIQLCADTAAGLNQGQAGAQQLVDTLSRIQATGEMSSRQLISLQTAGMDLDKAFSAVGMSAEQAMKAMDDGTLDAQTAIKALTDYMHEFDGSMEKSKNNLTDMWGDVSGNVQTAMGEIGASIADAFNQSGIVQELVDITQDFVDFVRGDGCGAFQDFKAVASEVLDFIGGLLTFVLDIMKLIIVAVSDVYSAFKSFGSQVVAAIQPAVDAVMTLYNAVKSVLSSVGMAFHSEVGKSFSSMLDSGLEPEERAERARAARENRFRQLNRGGSARGGSAGGSAGGGGSRTPSEQERAIEALIKKYSDADKILKNVIKSEIEMARVNLTMLPQSARAEEEVQVKLMAVKAAHDEVMAGYEKELEIARQISDPTTRDNVIQGIEKQIDAENRLANAKMKQAAFEGNLKANQKETETLLDRVFGTDDEYERKIKAIQDGVARIFETADYAKASGQMGDYTQDMDLLSKILQLSPDALQAELEAKNETLDEFVERNKERIAEGAKALTQSEQNAQTWANNTVKYATMVGDAMSNAMMDFITGAKSGKEALADFVSSMLKNAAQLLTRWLSLFAIFSIVGDPALAARNASAAVFGTNGGTVQLHKASGFKTITGGGGFFSNNADGGYIVGAGTGTSDSIPAMLSNGEYVIRASAVRNIGVPTLNALNTGRYHFADGGYVGGKKLEPSGVAGNLTLQVNALDASDFDNFLNLRGGAEHIQNMLYEAERRFSFSMG